ncbi:hypothetical protein ACEN2T_17710 [Pseudomonas sp. W22_MBD1_FP4]|uniref:hypothetical protein n=1 Tax=Pseudomonas sp. W22_MBD1_FP4 TaxID=3240272 RepID=UPI003F9725DB
MKTVITARVERRTWYVDGKYLGDASLFVADAGETAQELTGDFYGEWPGTRHFDGAAIVQAAQEQAIERRHLMLANHPEGMLGDAYDFPCKLGDWGEYRIITTAVAATG